MDIPAPPDPPSDELPLAEEMPPEPGHRTFPLVVLEELPLEEPLAPITRGLTPPGSPVLNSGGLTSPGSPVLNSGGLTSPGSPDTERPHANPGRLLFTI